MSQRKCGTCGIRKLRFMDVQKFLIAGGNMTALVWNCARAEQLAVAQHLLTEVEQVGFVREEDGVQCLEMMGGELCINATLALASLGGEEGALQVSGASDAVMFRNADITAISVPLPHTQTGKVVLFEGIGYICQEGFGEVSKEFLVAHARAHNLPAFGAVGYEGARIRPTVYVADTDSLCEESACGSGSIALSILTGARDIEQPTGERISVEREGGVFHVSAVVQRV